MYRPNKPNATSIKVRNTYAGETIEMKVNRIVNNKEPIKDGAPLVYTDRKEGVKAEMNIRTDRWELAVDAMDKVNADKLAKRVERQQKKDDLGKKAIEGMKAEGQPTAGTDATPQGDAK